MRVGFKVGPFIFSSSGRKRRRTQPLPRNAQGKIQRPALIFAVMIWTLFAAGVIWFIVQVIDAPKF